MYASFFFLLIRGRGLGKHRFFLKSLLISREEFFGIHSLGIFWESFMDTNYADYVLAEEDLRGLIIVIINGITVSYCIIKQVEGVAKR
ncbi:hypothetical protein FKM82_018135 [Ascaphus truei]